MKAHPQEFNPSLQEIKAEAKYLKSIKNNINHKPRDQRKMMYEHLVDVSNFED